MSARLYFDAFDLERGIADSKARGHQRILLHLCDFRGSCPLLEDVPLKLPVVLSVSLCLCPSGQGQERAMEYLQT